MRSVRIVGELDGNFAWNGRKMYDDADFQVDCDVPYELRGAAASVQSDGSGGWRLLRDPLGINKLFWARDADGIIAVAARPRRLVDEGHPFTEIRAIPRGCVLDLDPLRPKPEQFSILPSAWFSPDCSAVTQVEAIAGQIRSKLGRYAAAIAAAHPSAQAFVCLSGGLDSSGIAAIAREHFSSLVAVSFDLERAGGRASEDRLTARRLARELDIPLLEATVTAEALFETLDTILIEAIDWRDFNVHAALVNAALAEAIREASNDSAGASSALVLTGDLANEFLADYGPEHYRGSTYYLLPRLDPPTLRTSLLQGLDTCHREVGVFAAWGLPVVQPYAAAVDAFLALPVEFLRLEDRKARLSRAVFGNLLPEYVYSRPKVRAQVGGSETDGVLAACVDRGLDGFWLRQRFADLHDLPDSVALDRFIRAGRYRTAIPSLQVT